MLWSFILAAVGIFGLWLAGRSNPWGWVIGLGAQFLWLAYALLTHQWGFIATALAYGWVYGTNALRARKAGLFLLHRPVPASQVFAHLRDRHVD